MILSEVFSEILNRFVVFNPESLQYIAMYTSSFCMRRKEISVEYCHGIRHNVWSILMFSIFIAGTVRGNGTPEVSYTCRRS